MFVIISYIIPNLDFSKKKNKNKFEIHLSSNLKRRYNNVICCMKMCQYNISIFRLVYLQISWGCIC